MTKIGAVIPARSTSQRLPRKQLADLGGRPVIVRMIERLASSRFLSLNDVVLCTTEDSTDDELAAVAASVGASVFRGDRDDLVRRLADAVAAHGLEVVVEADGDDPFIDIGYVDRAVELLLHHSDVDVVVAPELPLGLAAKVVRGSAFERVRASYRTTSNDTGFMYFFTRSGLCKVEALPPGRPEHLRPEIRLTLDYEEDLELMRTVFNRLGGASRVFGVDEIVTLFEESPALLEVNSHLNEEYWDRTEDLVDLEFEVDGRRHVLRATGSASSGSGAQPDEDAAE